MRRKDREVTDSQKIREIILSCRCCRLGFYDNGQVYIVPLMRIMGGTYFTFTVRKKVENTA